MGLNARRVVVRCWLLACCSATGCVHVDSSALNRAALSAATLFITEVAQSTAYAGSTADKVEVFCAAAQGCPVFKVCDTAAGGGASCSAVQAALGAAQRVVVSRGTSITASDAVWLADAHGMELPGTRVGPFACDGGSASARADCEGASFGPCESPGLGAGSGACDAQARFAYALSFTGNQHGQPESSCARPVCQQLVAAIGGATSSIDFAVYGVRNQPTIMAALVAAQTRGVRVRGVVDTDNADCTAFGYPDTPLLIAQVAPDIVVCDVGSGYGYIMHNKFFVFDAARVWTGSTNLSDTETGGEYNTDVAVLIDSAQLAAVYTAEFAQMFSGKFHHRKTDSTPHVLDGWTDGTHVESYFSPTDQAIEHAVIPVIDNAAATLDVAMFYFTEDTVAQALLAAHARGVQVRMVLDAGGAANKYSKHGQLCAAGIAVKIENWGGKSHSKWAVADAATPQTAAVVFGSMNWTAAGNGQNDENTLYIRNAGLANGFAQEFERQWSDLAATPACTAVAAESAQSSACGSANDCSGSCSSGACCDQLDNDYDGRIDLQEEACACADGVDNEGDGYVDADDFDCRVPAEDP
jgi:phosphatidylserine/phosphatidylglycerophosphate/cardiolipin synthase-like enzyme